MGYGGRKQQNQAVDGRLGYDGKIGNGMVVELGMAWWQNWEWYGGRRQQNQAVDGRLRYGGRIGNGMVVEGSRIIGNQ